MYINKPYNLYYLFILLVLLVLFFILKKYRLNKKRKFIVDITASKLVFGANSAYYLIKSCLLFFVILLIVFSMARPQWGRLKKQTSKKALDIIFLLDVSKSMLAEDIIPSRFEKAKELTRLLLSQLTGNRVALVAFAGNTHTILPLTFDYSAFILFLDGLKNGYIEQNGTSIVDAVVNSTKLFINRESNSNIIIILTDGENHTSIDNAQLEKLRNSKVTIFSIGIGTTSGAYIPSNNSNKYFKDLLGNVIVTKLQSSLIKKLAILTNGKYYAENSSRLNLDLLIENINLIEKENTEIKGEVWDDHYQFFLIMVLILLTIDLIISDKKRLSVNE